MRSQVVLIKWLEEGNKWCVVVAKWQNSEQSVHLPEIELRCSQKYEFASSNDLLLF